MKKVILLYGIFSEEIANLPECNPNDDRNWMGWTKKELINRGHQVICPIVPKVWETPYKYSKWKKVLDEAGIDNDTILVGLSAGGVACMRYIAEETKIISKLILIAPAPYTEKEDHIANADDFSDFHLDDNLKNQIKNGTTIFVSDDEPLSGILNAVKIYKKKLDAKVIQFEDRGHFSFLIKTFPELLQEILKVGQIIV